MLQSSQVNGNVPCLSICALLCGRSQPSRLCLHGGRSRPPHSHTMPCEHLQPGHAASEDVLAMVSTSCSVWWSAWQCVGFSTLHMCPAGLELYSDCCWACIQAGMLLSPFGAQSFSSAVCHVYTDVLSPAGYTTNGHTGRADISACGEYARSSFCTSWHPSSQMHDSCPNAQQFTPAPCFAPSHMLRLPDAGRMSSQHRA
jgi:hypothetical protein